MTRPESFGPLHLARCVIDLGKLAIQELVWRVYDGQDCYGEDSPEDAAIPSALARRDEVA